MPATASTSTLCTRCNGTGQYHGTRRDGSAYVGSCFACQGYRSAFGRRGGFHRAPTPVAIPEATLPNVVSPILGLARGDAALMNFHDAYPRETEWLSNAQNAGNEFAMSLLGAIKRYGNLTLRQLAAVQRNLTPVANEPAVGIGTAGQPVTETQVRAGAAVLLTSLIPATRLADILPTPIMIDATPLRRALDAAAASGLRKVRLTLGRVEFKLSGSRFRNGGAGMILCYHEGSYAGHIDRANVFHNTAGRVVSHAALMAFGLAASDPRAAAQAHGNDTGNCACCRRLLSDPPSVMAGIGPVCIRRFGF